VSDDGSTVAPTDTIDDGKRLIRAGGDKGLSLGERMANQFYRLTWRTPLHALRLRGRYPLKLLAVPDDPIMGDPAAGDAMLAGRIERRGEKVDIESFDFAGTATTPRLSDYLQSFAWLRDLSTVARRDEGAPIAEALMRKWLAAHADSVSDAAWRAELWGWRILYWTMHAPLILSSSDLVYRSAVLNCLARGARHLDRGADRATQGVPRMAAWAGVIAAGLLIPGGDPRRAFGETGMARALASGFSSDGGVVCRSPQAQLYAIMLLTMVKAVYAARREEPPQMIADALARAVPALLGVTLGDGGLSSWQGAGGIAASQVEAVINATGIRTRPLRQTRDWGYQRMTAKDTVVIIDAAPPPVSRVAAGGCASTLAFELSDGSHRLIVNCGGARVGGAYVPASLGEGLRTTAAHSTLILSDNNSTAIHADGTLGRGVAEVALDRSERETGSRIEASHDGYAKRFGLIHNRTLSLASDGKEVRGEDVLLPSPAKKKPVAVPFAIRFHLAPGVEPTATADGMGALLRIAEGALWQFRCKGGTLALDDSLWVDGDGRLHPTHQLVVTGEAPPGGASVDWLLRRAG
jgi:uncharacterized heparinase superfamily protein